MRILHTSDWHIGRLLFGRKRHEEHEAFLEWLAALLERDRIDVCIVAGDVFDNTTPSNRSQALYYRFLRRATASGRCRVVVVAGNHDSPTFLDAPRDLLQGLGVHVMGAASASPADEVLVLNDQETGEACLVVLAIPYLRDRDIRVAQPGESLEDKERHLVEGIRHHYRQVFQAAEAKRAALGRPVPMIATGHLFAAGSVTVEGDGVRNLYIGTLAQIHGDVFPLGLDYLALGHLHVPQSVGGSQTIRYSGSPLPMGFGEAGQQKCVLTIDLSSGRPEVAVVPIPVFQSLETLRGDGDTIAARMKKLKNEGSLAWLEIVYEGDASAGALRERIEEAAAGSSLEVLRIRNTRLSSQALGSPEAGESLADLTPEDVFDRCLSAYDVPESRRGVLRRTFSETLAAMNAEDPGEV